MNLEMEKNMWKTFVLRNTKKYHPGNNEHERKAKKESKNIDKSSWIDKFAKYVISLIK